MAELLGQASGGFTESSSALRILHVGIRNNMGILTDDAFTQTNPPVVTTPATTISTKADTSRRGVLSGSIVFTRPDVGPNYIGGNVESLTNPLLETFLRPLGCFINSSNGNAYENLPGLASGKGPFVSAMGSYGNALYETQCLAALGGGAIAQGTDLVYTAGNELIASRNGYLMPRTSIITGAVRDNDLATTAAEREHGHAASTAIARLLMPADSDLNELVYNQLI